MRIGLPELDAPKRKLTDAEYLEFCRAQPDVRFERTAEGEIRIVPPAGLESSFQSGNLFSQLEAWARASKRGFAFDCSSEFILPSGAAYSPDAAFLSREKMVGLSRKDRLGFPAVAPDFVIEVMSPSDRLKAAHAKMAEWIANGVELGWLVYGKGQSVWVYRRNREPERCTRPDRVVGEGPVGGFVADFEIVWRGL